MSSFKIDRSVPVPDDTRNRYPIKDMEVGDSFAFPTHLQPSVATTASNLKRKEGKTYRIRRESDALCRIWRVE